MKAMEDAGPLDEPGGSVPGPSPTGGEGGSLTPSFPSFPNGKTSRSLVGCFLALEEAGLSNVAWLDGGLNAWFRAGLSGEGNEDWTFDARTPGSASAPEATDDFSERGRVGPKDRTNFRKNKSGTLMSSGGSALDPFGSWSVLLQKRKQQQGSDE